MQLEGAVIQALAWAAYAGRVRGTGLFSLCHLNLTQQEEWNGTDVQEVLLHISFLWPVLLAKTQGLVGWSRWEEEWQRKVFLMYFCLLTRILTALLSWPQKNSHTESQLPCLELQTCSRQQCDPKSLYSFQVLYQWLFRLFEVSVLCLFPYSVFLSLPPPEP